jgi:hypothetical protein
MKYGCTFFGIRNAFSFYNGITNPVERRYIPELIAPSNKKSIDPPVNKWKLMRTVEKQELNISPNPSSDIVTITTQLLDNREPTELRVTDILGNMILSKPLVQNYDKTMLPVNNLANGIYQCILYQKSKLQMSSKIAVTH